MSKNEVFWDFLGNAWKFLAEILYVDISRHYLQLFYRWLSRDIIFTHFEAISRFGCSQYALKMIFLEKFSSWNFYRLFYRFFKVRVPANMQTTQYLSYKRWSNSAREQLSTQATQHSVLQSYFYFCSTGFLDCWNVKYKTILKMIKILYRRSSKWQHKGGANALQA